MISALRRQRQDRNEPMLEPVAAVERKYHPDVVATFDNIARTRDERDRFADDNAVLTDRNAELQREVAFLTAKLRETEHNRDFYQRHYIALHTRLSDMGVMIETAIREAAHEAQAAGMTPVAAKTQIHDGLEEHLNGERQGGKEQ